MTTASMVDLDTVLRDRFGFASFRPGQREAIETLLEKRRLLCIQPTGYGKSLLYQLPSLILEGLTLVVSPLLALMRDQIGHLRHRHGIPAASLNSDQSDNENRRVCELVRAGTLQILFTAPEQLQNPVTRALLEGTRIGLLVVDEAHCISSWGHDFRPAYRAILPALTDLQRANPEIHVLALRATANNETETDITAQLGGKHTLAVLRAGMDRPNLALGIVPVQGTAQKLAWLAAFVARQSGGGILYCATREKTEIVSEYLSHRGLDVQAYHAGLDPQSKKTLQAAFISGRHQAIAATNALGMGIDKPDIRYIVHVDLPGSVTAYYQEVGRAGRDGKPARAFLLFDPEDVRVQEYFIHSAQPIPEDFAAIRGALTPGSDGRLPSVTAIRFRTGLHPTRVNVVLAELIEQGFVTERVQGRSRVFASSGRQGTPNLDRFVRQGSLRERELEAMVHYGHGRVGCLMAMLRKALGDAAPEPCHHCSLCREEAWDKTVPASADAEGWLTRRAIPIPANRLMDAGLALIDGSPQNQPFVQFMRRRADTAFPDLSEVLMSRLGEAVETLGKRRVFCSVVMIPSRSWCQRMSVARALGERLGVPVLADVLGITRAENPRQGALRNNDQRRENVTDLFRLTGNLHLGGGILLVDDYRGSGSTLREAARILRKAGFRGPIVPLVIARVRWRLGQTGMV